MSSARWSPILDGPNAARAWRVIDHVAAALRAPPPPYDGHVEDDLLRASLFAREAGFAVLYRYLARARGDDADLEALSQQYLEQALDRFEAIATDRPQLSYGFAGTGWALGHLSRDPDDAEALEGLDRALAALVTAKPATSPFMLNTGFVGYGVYALERMPAPSARELLASVCEKLVAAAEPDGAWCIRGAWMVDAGGDPPDQRHTGIRSGAAGAIAILQSAARWGIAGLDDTIERGLAWLSRQRRADGRLPAIPGGEPLVGYANGDAAIAAALLAACDLANGATAIAARDLAIDLGHAACSAPPDTTSVSLEGGASGNALAFMRLHAATGDARFADPARAWLVAILDAYDPAVALGGYRFYVPAWESQYLATIPTGHRELPGISFGVAGVALALLAAVTEIEPAWDRMFLLSARSS